MDGFDWLNAQISNSRLGTHPKGEHSANNMKRTNGVRAAYDTFLLRGFQVAFGCAADFNISKEAYPCPLIVVCHRRLASFAETR